MTDKMPETIKDLPLPDRMAEFLLWFCQRTDDGAIKADRCFVNFRERKHQADAMLVECNTRADLSSPTSEPIAWQHVCESGTSIFEDIVSATMRKKTRGGEIYPLYRSLQQPDIADQLAAALEKVVAKSFDCQDKNFRTTGSFLQSEWLEILEPLEAYRGKK